MKKLKELLKKDLTKEEIDILPTSFDIVGDIAIFNDFPDKLKRKEKLIAKKVMELNKHIKIVAKKVGTYSGKFRTPRLSIIKGEKRKSTMHKELGCLFKLDVEKCYFSARSENERLRIAKQVKEKEKILVMFSGIAPLPIIISKKTKAARIIGIELNKTAHKYAQENLRLNKIKNIILYNGDVKKIMPKIKEKFDRIVMPLPKSAESYLALAMKKLKHKGIMHLYTFAHEDEFGAIKKKYKKRFRYVKLVKSGHFGPDIYRVCLDLKK